MLGRGDADEAEQALALKLAEDFEGSRIAVPGPRPSVELEQIELGRAELGQPGGDILAEIFLGIAFVGPAVGRGRPDAGGRGGLGGDEDIFLFAGGFALAQHLADQAFAAAIAIPGGGVDEVDAKVQRAMERGEGVGLGLGAPRATNGPGAEADLGCVKGMFPEGTKFHDKVLRSVSVFLAGAELGPRLGRPAFEHPVHPVELRVVGEEFFRVKGRAVGGAPGGGETHAPGQRGDVQD